MSDVTKSAEPFRRPTFQVFDLVGKYLYQMASAIGTVNTLRGLYKRVEIPAEFSLVLGRTESVRKGIGLERIQGDLVFEGTPQFPSYEEAQDFLMEFQIKKDRKLGIRVFNYGQAHAQRRATSSKDGGETRQQFPEALIIYLGPPPYPPEMLVVRTIIHRSDIVYEIPVYSVLAHTVEEMERDNLHLLMPFLVLKHRKEATSSKTSTERRKALLQETLEMTVKVEDSLERGWKAGIITESDVAIVCDVMELLYIELYETQEGVMDFAEQLKLKGFTLKYPAWLAEKARLEAENAEVIRRTAQEKERIFSLWEQGYTPAQVKAMLTREAAESGDA